MKYTLLTLLSFVTIPLFAQYSAFMNRPLEYNGGLTGSTANRISTHTNLFRENKSISQTFGFNTGMSFDMFSKKLNGGVGIYYSEGKTRWKYRTYDGETFSSIFHFNTIGFIYSPRLSIARKYNLAPFIEGIYKYNGMKDEVSSCSSCDSPPIYTPKKMSQSIYYANLGFLINSENWFFGYKMHGLSSRMQNKPKDLIYIFQLGGFVLFNDNNKFGIGGMFEGRMGHKSEPDYLFFMYENYEDFSERKRYSPYLEIDPTIVSSFIKLSQFNIGVDWNVTSLRYIEYISTTLRYRVGYTSKRWKFGYSLGMKYRYFGKSPYHEIGVQYIFRKKKNECLDVFEI